MIYLRSEAREKAVAVYLMHERVELRVTVYWDSTFRSTVEVKGTDGLGDACWVPMKNPPSTALPAALFRVVTELNGRLQPQPIPEDPRCATCGVVKSKHQYRHPFTVAAGLGYFSERL